MHGRVVIALVLFLFILISFKGFLRKGNLARRFKVKDKFPLPEKSHTKSKRTGSDSKKSLDLLELFDFQAFFTPDLALTIKSEILEGKDGLDFGNKPVLEDKRKAEVKSHYQEGLKEYIKETLVREGRINEIPVEWLTDKKEDDNQEEILYEIDGDHIIERPNRSFHNEEVFFDDEDDFEEEEKCYQVRNCHWVILSETEKRLECQEELICAEDDSQDL